MTAYFVIRFKHLPEIEVLYEPHFPITDGLYKRLALIALLNEHLATSCLALASLYSDVICSSAFFFTPYTLYNFPRCLSILSTKLNIFKIRATPAFPAKVVKNMGARERRKRIWKHARLTIFFPFLYPLLYLVGIGYILLGMGLRTLGKAKIAVGALRGSCDRMTLRNY